jgi:hypothetical protein
MLKSRRDEATINRAMKVLNEPFVRRRCEAERGWGTGRTPWWLPGPWRLWQMARVGRLEPLPFDLLLCVARPKGWIGGMWDLNRSRRSIREIMMKLEACLGFFDQALRLRRGHVDCQGHRASCAAAHGAGFRAR